MRQKVDEAINTVKVTQGEYLALRVDCSPVEVEALLLEALGTPSDETTTWVAQLTAPIFASGRGRTLAMVVPYLSAALPPAEATAAAEKFLRAGAAKFGAEEEEAAEEDHDDLEVLCDCDFSREGPTPRTRSHRPCTPSIQKPLRREGVVSIVRPATHAAPCHARPRPATHAAP